MRLIAPVVALLMQRALSEQQFLLGASFEQPNSLTNDPIIQSIGHDITDAINTMLLDGKTQFNQTIGKETAVSVRILSIHEEFPLLDYHHTPRGLNISAGSVANVTANSMYRIGSISKLFTVYGLLVNHGRQVWDWSVTYFVPELKAIAENNASDIQSVRWGEVTVGALASQLAGIARDFNNADLSTQPFPAEAAGLPVLAPHDIPTCQGNEQQRACSRKEFFQGFPLRHPVFLPYVTPVYSNAAFRILGYVLEYVMEKPFEEVISNTIFGPLGLNQSATVLPSQGSVGVIPAGESGWFRDIGNETATSGFFCSSRDLAEFGRAILTHQQLTAEETRQWMKPSAHTASLSFSVGAPWEIWRTGSRITSGYTTDLYTKSGSDGLYNSLLILSPDYGVSISVMSAGADSSAVLSAASEAAVQRILPALDGISRAQACKKYCGMYRHAETNSSLTIAASGAEEDKTGPGLTVTAWISHGKDVEAAAQAYASATGSGAIASIRLLPAIVEEEAIRNAYRLIFVTEPPGYTPGVPPPPRVFDPTTEVWAAVDQLVYGKIAVDDFVFTLDRNGRYAQSVELRALRQTLVRV